MDWDTNPEIHEGSVQGKIKEGRDVGEFLRMVTNKG